MLMDMHTPCDGEGDREERAQREGEMGREIERGKGRRRDEEGEMRREGRGGWERRERELERGMDLNWE